MMLMLATMIFASTAVAEPDAALPSMDSIKAPKACTSTAAIESMQEEVNGLLTRIPASIGRLHDVAIKTEDPVTRAHLYTAAMVALGQSLHLQLQVLSTAGTCHGGGYETQATEVEALETTVLSNMATHLDAWSSELTAEQTKEVCALIPADMLVVNPVSACSEATRNAKN